MTEKKRVEERREGEREREGRRIVRGSKVKYFCLTKQYIFYCSNRQVRREIWEAAEAGAGSSSRRLHRTTSAATSGQDQLASMSVADLNKRFINTFLYLQVVITTSPCVCQLITPRYPGQALHPDRHGGLPRGAEQPAGPVPGAHKQVPAPALHRQAGAGGGWKIFDNVY